MFTLEIISMLLKFAEHARKVTRNARFFGDDQGFARDFWRIGVHEIFTKYWPGSCLMNLFISRVSKLEDTTWLGKLHFVMISSMPVSESFSASKTAFSESPSISERGAIASGAAASGKSVCISSKISAAQLT